MGVRLFSGIVLALALSALAGCGSTDEDPLSLFAGVGSERAGEVLLEWTGEPPGVPGWQYRCRSFGGWASGDGTCGQGNVHAPEWGEWRDIQRKRTRITRHRVTGLTPGVFYEFQVRPRSEDGRNAPSEPAELMAHPAGFDRVVHAIHGRLLEGGGTFRFGDSNFIFTIPTSGRWGGSEGEVYNAEYGGALRVDAATGRIGQRYSAEGAPDGIDDQFDQIIASIRFEPERPDPPLMALVGGVGEVVLQWTGVTGATRWQYRQRESPYPAEPIEGGWGMWTDIPGSDEHTTSYRVAGIPARHRFDFQIRPWTSAGPGAAYDPVLNFGTGDFFPSDTLARPGAAELLESGRTFHLGGGLVLDVPPGARIAADVREEVWIPQPGGGRVGSPGTWWSCSILDFDSGSWLWLNLGTGEYLERHVTAEGLRRGVDALFDTIVASTRRVPPS